MSFQPKDGAVSFGLSDKTYIAPKFQAAFGIWNAYNRVRARFEIVSDASAAEEVLNPHLTWHPPKDNLIRSLEPLAGEGGDDSDAALFAAGLFSGCGDRAKGQSEARELLSRARGAREVVMATEADWIAGPGRPPGTRDNPELDMFLELFIGAAYRNGLRRSAYNDRDIDKAAGSLIKVVKIVEPCFQKGFRPKSDKTLRNAIDRIRKAARELPAWKAGVIPEGMVDHGAPPTSQKLKSATD